MPACRAAACGEFGATVADLHGEQPGQPVEVAVAGVVEDRHAFAAGDDRRRDVRTVPREVQPEVVEHGVGERNARADVHDLKQVSEFEALRPHLMSVAYRLTGTVADAEDIVQEAWLRWDRPVPRRDRRPAGVADHRGEPARPGPVAVGRAPARDVHRALAARAGGDRPGSTTSTRCPPWWRDEDARFAAMVVLERLSPDQRVAFVLHDGFAVPFAEVADVLGTSEAAARQLASRAREVVAAAPPPNPIPSHDEVVGKLMAAMAGGDLDAVVALLHPDVTFTGDSDGKAPTAPGDPRGGQGGPVHARPAQRYGPAMLPAYQLAFVNGELGIYTAGCRPTTIPRDAAADHGVTVRDGKVCALWDIANPDKFTGSPLRDSGPIQGTRHASPELKPCSVMPSAVFIRARMFSTPI